MLDHVALVLRRLEPTLERLVERDLVAGPIEEFPSEGTREVYLSAPGAGGAGRLLLLQPLGEDGPYARALAKRGPGLHHVAWAAADLNACVAEARGWLLLPASLQTIPATQTAWLARPGVPTLLEVMQTQPPEGPPTVEAVGLPAAVEALVPRAGLERSEDGVWLRVGGEQLAVSDLA